MSAVPHSSRYEDYNRGSLSGNRRPTFGSPLSSNDRDIKRFDAKMHVRMNEAQTRQDWTAITDELIAASGKLYTEVGGLRGKVKEHFLGDCPDPELRKKLNQALMPKKSGSVRPHVEQQQSTKRQQADAKRAANRAARHAAQPARGSSSGGGNKPGQQGKQKGGKKK